MSRSAGWACWQFGNCQHISCRCTANSATRKRQHRIRLGSTMTTTHNPSPIPGLAVLAALVVALVAVAAVTVFYWERDRVVPRHPRSDVQAASASAKPENKDAQFLFLLTAQGLQPSGAGNATINDAHRICSRLERGESEQQIVEDIVRGSRDMSNDTASTFAETAIAVYCQQR
jgi:hypothetical protein